MLSRKALCLLLLLAPLAISAKADPASWLAPYAAAQESTKSGIDKKNPTIHYHNTRVLLSSQEVQTLSGQPGTIGAARLLAALTTAEILLPDGSTLSDFASDWVNSALPAVTLYRVTYRGKGPRGMPTTLSGLVVVPAETATPLEGILIYMHATTTQRNDAPGDRAQEAYAAITAFANRGTVLAMPDYLGYGANHGNHPYAMGELNAPAGEGMILAARELMKRLRRPGGNQILVTGYSEGGGNALALSKYLEEKGDSALMPTRSAPMSGPYDLSGATALSFIGKQPPISYQENFSSKPTLLSFAAVSTSRILRDPLSDYLQPPLAAEAKGEFPGSLAESALGSRLLTTVVDQLNYVNLKTMSPNPENLLQPTLVNAIRTQDLANPALALWAENDAVDWTPKSRIMLLGILQDELVPFAGSSYPTPNAWAPLNPAPAPYAEGNAQNVIAAMRQKGLGKERIGWTAFNGAINALTDPVTISHAAGMMPASILAQSFLYHPETAIPQLQDPAP